MSAKTQRRRAVCLHDDPSWCTDACFSTVRERHQAAARRARYRMSIRAARRLIRIRRAAEAVLLSALWMAAVYLIGLLALNPPHWS